MKPENFFKSLEDTAEARLVSLGPDLYKKFTQIWTNPAKDLNKNLKVFRKEITEDKISRTIYFQNPYTTYYLRHNSQKNIISLSDGRNFTFNFPAEPLLFPPDCVMLNTIPLFSSYNSLKFKIIEIMESL